VIAPHRRVEIDHPIDDYLARLGLLLVARTAEERLEALVDFRWDVGERVEQMGVPHRTIGFGRGVLMRDPVEDRDVLAERLAV
jgi:hypothetical protein